MPESRIHSHYDNLKVARDAPLDVIRAAYRSLSAKYHPDKNPDDAEAHRIMVLINRAYDVLSDPEKRRAHDDWLAAQENAASPGAPPPPPPPRTKRPEAPRYFSGAAALADFAPSTQERLRARLRTGEKSRFRARTGSIGWAWFRLAASTAWLVLALWESQRSRTQLLLMLPMLWAAAWLWTNALERIWQWNTAPFREWIAVTPVWIIRTTFDWVEYWPVAQVSEVGVVNHQANGRYQRTSLRIGLQDGQSVKLTLPSEAAVAALERHLESCRERLARASVEQDHAWFATQDDLFEHRPAHYWVPRLPRQPGRVKARFWLGFSASALMTFALAAASR